MRSTQFYLGLKYYFKQFLFSRSKLRHLKEFILKRARREFRGLLKPELVYFIPCKSYLYVHQHMSSVYSGFYEYMVARYLVKRIRELKPCVFFDIGSYVGHFSLLAAREGCYVLSFEPDPRSFVLLSNNIALHNLEEKILIFNKALCEKDGVKISFTLSKPPSESSYTKYLREDLVYSTVQVECMSIDYVASSLKNILQGKSLIMKIDVEGAALDVLKGGLNTIKTYKPLIILEVHRTYDEKCEFKAIELLRSLNYGFRLLEFRSPKSFIVALEPQPLSVSR